MKTLIERLNSYYTDEDIELIDVFEDCVAAANRLELARALLLRRISNPGPTWYTDAKEFLETLDQ